MQFERLYHNAASTAEGPVDTERGGLSHCSAVSLLQNAFPQALEASAYALRKRLICPRWWLVGVMSQWMLKDLEALSERIGLNTEDYVFVGPALNAKNFPLVVALWTELMAQVSAEGFDGLTVELNLRRILRGTATEIFDQREFLTHYLSAALRIQKLKVSTLKNGRSRAKVAPHKSAQLTLESVGLVQIFENVILSESDSQKLFITFARCPRKLFSANLNELLPSALKSKCPEQQVQRYASALVTLQPDVLRAMSRSLSPKKLVPYLSLEITKSEQTGTSFADSRHLSDGVWRGRSILSQELARLHKDELSQSRALYDHGLLSWENEAPRKRIRAIKRDSEASGHQGSGIVHCWRLSQHVIDAISFEQALTQYVTTHDNVSAQTLAQTAPSDMLNDARTSCVPEHEVEAELEVEAIVPVISTNSGSRKIMKAALSADQITDVPALNYASPMVTAAQKHTALFGSSQSLLSQTSSSKTIEVSLSEKPAAQLQPQKRVVAFTQQRDPHSTVWTDDEYLMCVAEFYESLTPLQQQAFERERRRMSPEQFKVYVTPALKRFKISNA